MGVVCCITGCENRNDVQKHLHFYKIPCKNTPFEQRRRRDWLQAIKRDDWKHPEWTESRINQQRVCSSHFVSGERSDDPNNIDWIPTKFTHAAAVPINKLLAKKKNMDDRNKRSLKRASKKLKFEACDSEKKKKKEIFE